MIQKIDLASVFDKDNGEWVDNGIVRDGDLGLVSVHLLPPHSTAFPSKKLRGQSRPDNYSFDDQVLKNPHTHTRTRLEPFPTFLPGLCLPETESRLGSQIIRKIPRDNTIVEWLVDCRSNVTCDR
jgi:hypothetical protein